MTVSFYYKLAILSLLVFDFCLFITAVCIVPAYIFSSIKDNVVSAALKIQTEESVPPLSQQTMETINSINDKLTVVENAEKDKFLISEKVINAILSKKMPNIKITQISYDNTSTQGKKVSILGTAPSREVLLSFREALESDSNFKSIDLPISNFVKGSDIQFYLNLIPK